MTSRLLTIPSRNLEFKFKKSQCLDKSNGDLGFSRIFLKLKPLPPHTPFPLKDLCFEKQTKCPSVFKLHICSKPFIMSMK